MLLLSVNRALGGMEKCICRAGGTEGGLHGTLEDFCCLSLVLCRSFAAFFLSGGFYTVRDLALASVYSWVVQ